MPIKIINPRIEDDLLLAQFYERVYRFDHILTDKRFRSWWLRANPNYKGQGYSCKVAVLDGEFIGHCAYIPVSLWSGERTYRAVWGGNFIVDKRFRGRGIGRQLHQAINQEVEVFLDVGANATARDILRKFGWLNFGSLNRAVGVLDAGAAQFAIARKLSPAEMITVPPNVPETRVTNFKHCGEEVDDFWLCLRPGLINATERSATFLNWRYLNHPFFDYQTLVVWEGGKMVGLAVFRFQTVPEHRATLMRVVEFLAPPKTGRSLLAALVGLAREKSAALIDFFCAGRSHLDFFQDFGFLLSPAADQFTRLFDPVDLARPGFGTISFNGGNIHSRLPAEIFNRQENWYVTSGDGDQDRPNRILPPIV